MSQTVHEIGIILNGMMWRMGINQHLLRSIVLIIEQGGVPIRRSRHARSILVGRNPDKLEDRARRSGIDKWTTDLDSA